MNEEVENIKTKYREEVEQFITEWKKYTHIHDLWLYVDRFMEYIEKLKVLEPEDRDQFIKIAKKYATSKAKGVPDPLHIERGYKDDIDLKAYKELIPYLLGEDIFDIRAGKKVFEIEHLNSIDPKELTLDRSKAKKTFWYLMQYKHILALRAVKELHSKGTESPETPPDPKDAASEHEEVKTNKAKAFEIAKKFKANTRSGSKKYTVQDIAFVMEVALNNQDEGVYSEIIKMCESKNDCPNNIKGMRPETAVKWIKKIDYEEGFERK